MSPETTPVLVGVGEIIDRPADPAEGAEPLALMEQALRRAQADAGAALLEKLDALFLVNQITWPYADMPAQLADRIGATPAHAIYGPVGGETPVRFIHAAAARIAGGQSQIAAIVGAEAQNTLDRARRAAIRLPWTAKPDKYENPLRGADLVHAAALNLGVFMPVTIYPFYENATLKHWGQTPAEAQAESGALGAAFSRVAAENPSAWLPRLHTQQEIVTPSAANRLIAWPYTKLMVANPSVNQGGAVIVTSLAAARAAGIADGKCIFIHGGAHANEPRDYLQRDIYYASTAQDAVLHDAMRVADGNDFTAVELYSCFPCVPKMARRTLGLADDFTPTVAGGLTFFGAPLNTYMTHAACAMVRRLRAHPGTGLLYGQGEFVTKHHALVLSTVPPAGATLTGDTSVQAAADRARGAVPSFSTTETGPARLESFTIIYDREGAPSHGVVIARMNTGPRVLARVSPDDLAPLTDLAVSPIGSAGSVHANDPLTWEFA
jgi:acetyl-CoA acetyltransferase